MRLLRIARNFSGCLQTPAPGVQSELCRGRGVAHRGKRNGHRGTDCGTDCGSQARNRSGWTKQLGTTRSAK